jgi:hypothetical protein
MFGEAAGVVNYFSDKSTDETLRSSSAKYLHDTNSISI